MKQKITTLLFIAASVLALSSCLNNDDDNKTNYAADYKNAVGQYTGKMYALDYNENPQKPDTLMHDVTATITADSIISFSSFPLYFIAKEISDNELREAVIARGNTNLKVHYFIYNKGDEYLYSSIYPESVIINDLDYKGGKHKLTFSFVLRSEGFIYPRKYLHAPMYVGGVFLDDVLFEDFANSQKTAPRLLLQFQGGTNQ